MFNLRSLNSHLALRVGLFALAFLSFNLTPRAFAQDFSLQASAPNPSSVDPGVDSLSTITIDGTSNTVTLSCAVTPVQENGATCSIQQTANPPATAALTIQTTTVTPPTVYQITVTGTDGTNTHSVSVNVTVLAVTPVYTITVTTPMTPGSIHAGSGATAGITITPVNGYSGDVTLSCSAITPTVSPSPVCSFDPPTVTVTTGTAQVATLTVSTFSTTTTTATATRALSVFLLPIPGLVLLGACFGSRRRKLLHTLMLLSLIAALLFVPACGNNNNSTSGTDTSGNTPNNTYTFTLNAADTNAVVPSNGTQTISLTVN